MLLITVLEVKQEESLPGRPQQQFFTIFHRLEFNFRSDSEEQRHLKEREKTNKQTDRQERTDGRIHIV